MNDLINRQAAIDAVVAEGRNVDSRYLESERIIHESDAVEAIAMLPSAQSTLYGYQIEHLAMIARVMQKENITPEKAVEAFEDITRIVRMIIDEQKEIIRKAVEECRI